MLITADTAWVLRDEIEAPRLQAEELVGGRDQFFQLYRHPTPTSAPLGQVAMMVFCARGYGLYANLTRFVCFGPLFGQQQQLHQQMREIEAAALDQCQMGVPLQHIFSRLKQGYEQQGYPNAIHEHHQGGTNGYLAREIVATSETTATLQPGMAIAWNPSLQGAKIEDTFLILEQGQLENLTLEPDWPNVTVHDRPRPLPLEIV